jgi:hypothetical protein
MRPPLEQHDRQLDELEVRSLSDESGVVPTQVRTLFRHERARVGMGAKVHSYLAVLTASNVRGMLRRVAHRREAAQAIQECWNGAQTPREPSNASGDAERALKS